VAQTGGRENGQVMWRCKGQEHGVHGWTDRRAGGQTDGADGRVNGWVSGSASAVKSWQSAISALIKVSLEN